MYQSTTIIGHLGRDPEMRYMPNGDPVTSFSVATSRQWNDRNGQKVKETTWFRVSVFGKQAETVNQYLHKGSLVLVEGRLRVDPKTGGPAYILHPTASGFVAYSAICPHAGCTVMYEANERFVCPCHGSQFNATTGAVLQGPASTGLSSISIVEGSDGQLYVQG